VQRASVEATICTLPLWVSRFAPAPIESLRGGDSWRESSSPMQSHSAAIPPALPASDAAWRRFLFWCFVTICGVRWFIIQKFASPVAYGDDLDGVARRILLPWHNGTLHASALFAAHNGDHRIFFTRVWEIFWFVVNGSWDPKLVMLAKVPIFATAATIFIHLLAGRIGAYRWLAGSALACLFAFPFAFANCIWAFQSQFDFFFLFTALGWLALLRGRTITALVLAAVSILALGSGPIVAASYVPFFLAEWLERRWSMRKTVGFTIVALVVVGIGLASPTKDAMPHAGTPMDKGLMLVRIYAWPFSNLGSIIERLPETAHYIPAPLRRFPNADHPYVIHAAEILHRHPGLVVMFHLVCAALVIAPTAWLLAAVLRRRVSVRTAAGTLGVAGFAFLMIAATAVARANQVTIAPRFLDHVALAGFASLAAGLLLVAHYRRGAVLLGLWAAVMGVGYVGTIAVTTIQLTRRAPAVAQSVLQQYYHTTPHDHSAMVDGDAFRRFIVSDDPTQFMSELDTPGLENVLPVEIVHPAAPVGWAARIAFALARFAPLLALVGLAGLVWTALRAPRLGRKGIAPIAAAAPVATT